MASLSEFSTVRAPRGARGRSKRGCATFEEAVEGMTDPPDDLVEAVDRIRRALADF